MKTQKIYKLIEDKLPEEFIIALTTNLPPYSINYIISELLNIELQTFIKEPQNLESNSIIKNQIKLQVDSARFDYIKWESLDSIKTLLIYPNQQEITVKVDNPTIFSIPNENKTYETIYLLPEKKHFDYIICFKGYDENEIDQIFSLVKDSNKFKSVYKEPANEAFIELVEMLYSEYDE